MSGLRFLGVLAAIMFLIVTALRYRRHLLGKSDLIWWWGIGLVLLLIAARPALLNRLRDLWAETLAQIASGRLMSVIITAIVVIHAPTLRRETDPAPHGTITNPQLKDQPGIQVLIPVCTGLWLSANSMS
jgi:hypothetical protein